MKIKNENLPKHIGIIMDGNGRWATKRKLPRIVGHREGIKAIKNIIEVAVSLNIEILTLFAFSTENWKRDREEINGIFEIINNYLVEEKNYLLEQNLKITIMGDLSALPLNIQIKLKEIINQTKNNTGLIVNIGINYGARDEIIRAVKIMIDKKEDICIDNLQKHLYSGDFPDPDLIIRTSGEKRLSNFMLFQCAYSELYFTKTFWPSFNKKHFLKALRNYSKRERRFGGNHNKKQK